MITPMIQPPYPTRQGTLRLGDLSVHPKGPFRHISSDDVDACVHRLREGLTFPLPFTVQDTQGCPLLDGYTRFRAYKIAFPDDWMDRDVDVVFLSCSDSEAALAALEINMATGVRFTDAEALDALLQLGPAVLAPDGTPLRPRIAPLAARLNLPVKAVMAAVRAEFSYDAPATARSRATDSGAALHAMTQAQSASASLPAIPGAPPVSGPLPQTPTALNVTITITHIEQLLTILRSWPANGAPPPLRGALAALRNNLASGLRHASEDTP